MNLDQCYNTQQFRRLARRRLPGPIFHYIDGAADDEVTYRRNTEAYDECDLVPSVLAGVESIDGELVNVEHGNPDYRDGGRQVDAGAGRVD